MKADSAIDHEEFNYLLEIDPSFSQWRNLALEWLDLHSAVGKRKKLRGALKKFFLSYIEASAIDRRPFAIFERQAKYPALWSIFAGANTREKGRKLEHDYIVDFLDWCLKEKLSEVKQGSGKSARSSRRNPFRRLCKKVIYKNLAVDFSYVLDQDPTMEVWCSLANAWMALQRRCGQAKLEALSKFLLLYIVGCDLDRNPYTFLRRSTVKPSFLSVILQSRSARSTGGQEPGPHEVEFNNRVHEFLNWVLEEKLSVEDDNGRPMIPPEYHNPVSAANGATPFPAETLKATLPYRYIKQLRTMLASGPHFSGWTWAHAALDGGNSGGDWFTVDPSVIDKTDPDCVWRERSSTAYERKHHNAPARVVELWSPVRSVAVYLKLELPLRGFQVRMLDSGESDTWRYESGKFVLSKAPLRLGSERHPYQKGVFHRSPNEAAAGLYVNTNKTADAKKDDSARGYVIPWTYEPALYWLERLRNWQEKYNPISSRTPWRTLQHKHFGKLPPPREMLDKRSDVCFLFRDPTEKPGQRDKPLPHNALSRLWYLLLQELEKRCERNGELLDDGCALRFVDPSSDTATLYPLHALRVSLITAYVLEGGVPFAIVSKLIAGHARLVMTLYYTKAGKAHVTEVMAEAERRMLEDDAVSYKRFLLERTYQEIEERFAFVSPDSIAACKKQASAAGFIFDDKGICPVGGALCDVGGEQMPSKRGAKIPDHAPVAGYPEERNCVRCRFFITGPAFIPGLVARFNEISYRASECASRYRGCEEEARMLEDRRSACEQDDSIFLDSSALEAAYQRLQAEAEKANKLLTDLQSCNRLIARAIDITNREIEGVPLVASGALADLRYALNETKSELHQLEVICENAVVFHEIDASKATFRRSQILDAMLEMNGRAPIFYRLTEEQQRVVGNEVMKLIKMRTGGLANAVEIVEGRRRLQELGLLDETLDVLEDNLRGSGPRCITDTGMSAIEWREVSKDVA